MRQVSGMEELDRRVERSVIEQQLISKNAPNMLVLSSLGNARWSLIPMHGIGVKMGQATSGVWLSRKWYHLCDRYGPGD